MRKLIMLLFVSAACGCVLRGSSYGNHDVSEQAFIIREVSACLADSDIVIFFSRSDEKRCPEDLIPVPFTGILNLEYCRKIAVLKGRDRLEYFSDVYTYKPDIPSGTRWQEYYNAFDARLYGTFYGDNQLHVLFVKRSRGINRAEADRGGFAKMFTEAMMRIDPDYLSHPDEMVSDFEKMEGSAFLEKYGLSKAFDVAVYDITCVVSFGFAGDVEISVPASQVGGKKMAERKLSNRELMKGDEKFQVRISKRELSELVYIAYVCDDDSGGIEAYNESQRKNPQFLVPLSEPVEFKTELVRKIHQKITTGHVEEDAEFNRHRR